MFSWLIEHILSNLPSWLWPVVAGAGATTYFLARIVDTFPTIKPYAFFVKPVSFAVMLVGVFMYGGAGITAIYQAQINEMQAKMAAAQTASTDANGNLHTKIVTKTKVIHDVQVVIKERIKEVEKKIDADCKLDPEATKILNDAAKNPLGATK